MVRWCKNTEGTSSGFSGTCLTRLLSCLTATSPPCRWSGRPGGSGCWEDSVGDLSGYHFWINNPDFRLFKPEEPAEDSPLTPSWCSVSRPLVEWGDTLLRNLTYRPTP